MKEDHPRGFGARGWVFHTGTLDQVALTGFNFSAFLSVELPGSRPTGCFGSQHRTGTAWGKT